MTNKDCGERIETLEIRLSHQEAAIDELTRTLLRQEQMLNEQVQIIDRLQVQIRSLAGSPVASSDDETPPPHY